MLRLLSACRVFGAIPVIAVEESVAIIVDAVVADFGASCIVCAVEVDAVDVAVSIVVFAIIADFVLIAA